MNKENDNRQECQFEVWTECNSRCVFCYLSTNNIKTLDDIKIKQMNEIIDSMKADDFCEKFNKVAFIGGEFYQGQLSNPEVKSKFMEMMDVAADLLNSGKITEVWTCATLTIGDQKDMYEVLKKFNDISKVWVLTSYDTIGRFHTPKMKQTWLDNMQKLRDTYKDIKINITSILTGDFIDKYLEGTLDLWEIANKYNAAIFLKPACPIDRNEKSQYTKEETNQIIPNFFPTRDKFIEFLYKFKMNEPEFMYDKLFNMKYRSDYLYRFEEGEMHCSHRVKETQQEFYDKQIADNVVNKCGHSSQYQIYLDSDECAVCDKEMIKEMVND